MCNEYSLPQISILCLLKCFEVSFVNRTQNLSKNSKPFWRIRFGRGSVVRPPSNGDGIRDIQHSMSMVDTRLHVWFIMTVYYKMRQKFITKCVRFFDTKCDSFITKCDSYYKMRRLLQIVTVQGLMINQLSHVHTCPSYHQFFLLM